MSASFRSLLQACAVGAMTAAFLASSFSESIADGTYREDGALETSQNGWSADELIPLSTRHVAGAAPAFTVRDGVLGDLLVNVALRYDRRVEGISEAPDEGGYNRRKIRGEDEWSDHASGTAIDVNTTCRPLGVTAAASMTPSQIAAVHRIVDEADGAIQWGGDYDDPARGGTRGGRPDPMHFAIAPGVTESRARRTLATLGGASPRAIAGQPSAPVCKPQGSA